MGLFDFFPYTSGHTLNLDWFIKTVKKLGVDFQIFKDEVNAKVATIPAEVAAEVEEAVSGIAAADINALPGIESAEYPGCYFRTGASFVEWINPPLLAGIEYRTAERWQGSPVYTKLVNCGNFPAQGATSYTEFARGVKQIVRIAGSVADGAYIPYISTDAKIYISGTIVSGTGNIVIYAELGNLSESSCLAQLWYTKK